MIGMVRDTWRAVLVVVAAILLREVFAGREAAVTPAPAAPQTVATQMQFQPMPAWPQPQPPAWQPAEPDRPLRRVAAALTELGDSMIGVVRR
jgi:hypothetical protein